ncbi:MAG TPA: 2Fe-2S iron-sulfur cluster-binding protein, partial [Devosia sp.]|nr:2Fe-2S iron-sulfur cluster-binding protein [Devosia sp.]
MRLAADAAHQFGGIELDRSRPLSFKLDGHKISGFAGDTVLSAILAAGIDTYGSFAGTSLGLSPRLAPLVTAKNGTPLPMERTPAIEGADLATVGTRRGLAMRHPHSLRHVLNDLADPPWFRAKPDETRNFDLLIVGGGVSGL